jgi:transmembrane sensor
MKESSNNHDENLEKADRVAYLIAGHINDTLTEPEKDELDDWITESDENLELFEKLTDEDNIEAGIQQHLRLEKEKASALEGIKESIGLKQKSTLQIIWPYMAAASVVLIIVSLVLFNNNKIKNNEKPIAQGTTKNYIAAGSDKAVLTLSDGRTVILDSSGTGLLANEGNITISKGAQGEIVYEGTSMTTQYNVVSTPRGGQFKITLGDGTKVWLNAESSIKYPAGFATAERVVELRGEGYFEVAKNESKPFKVKILTSSGDGGMVEVLGTHFNINGYGDEGVVKTTLLEGSVRVTKGEITKTLIPGQAALINGGIKIITAQVNEETAWKDGKFLFRDETIHSIGEQIKRWYDVQVEYEGNNKQLFNTEVSRSVPLSDLLEGLEGTAQVKFHLEGRKLIIRP